MSQKQAKSRLKPRGKPEAGKATQWPKGVSGNPGGRPKGESLTTKLRRLLEEKDPEHGTKADKLIALALEYADRGDFRYFKEIYERVDGKVPDRVANADGSNIHLIDRPSWEKL